MLGVTVRGWVVSIDIGGSLRQEGPLSVKDGLNEDLIGGSWVPIGP